MGQHTSRPASSESDRDGNAEWNSHTGIVSRFRSVGNWWPGIRQSLNLYGNESIPNINVENAFPDRAEWAGYQRPTPVSWHHLGGNSPAYGDGFAKESK